MRIALCSDEVYPVHELVERALLARGHELERFGVLSSGGTSSWALGAEAAALAVAGGRCAEGIFFCWSGTGISISANKVPGVRAALCTDAPTARAARLYNHANVLCLSNRLLSGDVAKEILDAWFEPYAPEVGAAGVSELSAVEARQLRR
ncbi:MAG TPA: RpiB/LacA/LacB family sugar-phosphate isomerase [Polyangiaceae bacterium]|nr:RpiB/LacA/LacB family sugar-phosphate isomerase [Polyangiaceae bacterium]